MGLIAPPYCVRIKRHSTAPKLTFPYTNPDGTPFDLTGASLLRFHMREDGQTLLKVDAAAAASVPLTSGVLEYDWVAVDTDTAGFYDAEFEFEKGGKKYHVPDDGRFIRVEIVADLNDA